jgi:PD-(D/E)XK endonuclease
MNNPGELIQDPKQRGEWAELCFMAKAASLGLHVSKPYGDTSRYDVGVESEGRILRVQVKSSMHHRRGIDSYIFQIHTASGRQYDKGAVDFFALYMIPVDTWYIIPFERIGHQLGVQLTVNSRRPRYGEYREAWHLLREPPARKKCPLTHTTPPPCEGDPLESCMQCPDSSAGCIVTRCRD